MSRYPLVPLGDVLEPYIDEVVVDPEATYPIAGVYSFGRGLISRTQIVGSETKYAKLHRLHAGQLVVSRLNGWEGALAVVDTDHDGHFVSQEFPTFDVRGDMALTPFVGLLARWPGLWAGLLRNARGLGAETGARRLRITADRLLATEVPLPPLNEQARIVDRMNRVATARDRAESSAWLAQTLNDSMVRAALGDGSGHPLVPLDDILELSVDEVAVEPEATYPIAGVYSFGRGLFARTPIVGTDTKYTKLHRLHTGQLVMSRLKAWEGAVAVVQSEFDGMHVSPEFPTFSARIGRASTEFVDLITRWPAFWDSLLGHSRGIGARRERVSADRLLATAAPLPPLDEQARIVDRMNRVATVRARADARVRTIVALEQSTLSASLGLESG